MTDQNRPSLYERLGGVCSIATVVDDFQLTLDKFGVPQAEQKELKAIVDSTRYNIVA